MGEGDDTTGGTVERHETAGKGVERDETAGETVDGLRVARDGGVLTLTLDAPDRRNAISDAMAARLVAALERAQTDDDVRAILLTAIGPDFCSGADIVARNADPDAKPRTGSIQRRVTTLAHRLVPLVVTTQVPVVCAARGWIAGLGLHLAAAADFTFVAEDARLWEPFASRGFTPDSGATWLLPRLVGPARARELLLLGRELRGDEAAAWGLVHRAVPDAELDATAATLARRLAEGPTVMLGLTKWLLARGADRSLEDHLPDEAFALELSSRSPDFREGMRAFRERREPRFEGR